MATDYKRAPFWQAFDPKRPSTTFVVESGEMVTFDFDETKHPRDTHGRFDDGDEETPKFDEPGGFRKLSQQEMHDWMVQRSLDRGDSQARAEQIARILYGERSKYELHVNAAGQSVEFHSSARVSAAKKDEILMTVDQLHDLYPNRLVNVSVPQTSVAKSLSDGAIGISARGSGQIILNPQAVKPQAMERMQNSSSFMQSMGRDDVTPTWYIMFHEYGHTMDVPKARGRSEETERALTTMPAGSYYGRTSQDESLRPQMDRFLNPRSVRQGKRDGSEAFAEAFAEWHLTNGRTDDPLARELARTEHWVGG